MFQRPLGFASILSSSGDRDVRIICDGGSASVETSSLLLALSSFHLRVVLADILGERSRADDEKIVVYLPDYSSAAVRGVITCITVGEAVADSQSQLEEMQSLFTDMGINTFDGSEKPVRRLPVAQTRDDGQFLAAAGFHHRHHNTTEPSGDFGGHFLAPTFHPDDSYQTGHLVSDVKPEIKVENLGEEMPFELEDYLSHESEIYDPAGDVLEPKEEKSSKSRRQKRGRSQNGVAFSADPGASEGSPKKRGRPKSTKVKADTRKRVMNCPVCFFDGGTVASTIDHYNMLIGEHQTVPVELPHESRHKQHIICPICLKGALSPPSFRFHFRIHLEDAHNKTTKCASCELDLETVEGYVAHLKEHTNQARRHKNNTLKECTYCKKMVKLGSLAAHLEICRRKAQNDYFRCDKCTFKTAHRGHFDGHMKLVHSIGKDEEALLHCPVCHMKFYRNYHLKKHMNTHTDVKSYCCDVCGSQFKSESDVVGHKNRTHGLFKWQCVECLQKFRDKAKAHKHVFIHSDLPSHGCTICGLELKNESQARAHVQNVHHQPTVGNIRTVNKEQFNEIEKQLIRKIEATQDGNVFKRMRGSNLSNARELARMKAAQEQQVSMDQT